MLLDELNRLFSDVVHPGYAGLAVSYHCDWEPVLHHLDRKNWRVVTFADFDSLADFDETVCVLSLKGFIYFLPGLIRVALTEPGSRYAVASALAARFTCPQPLAGEKAEDKRRHVAQLNSIAKLLDALSPDRREFLIRFLASTLESEPTPCPVVVDSAIFNLRIGGAFSYDQEAVSQWVAKSLRAFSVS